MCLSLGDTVFKVSGSAATTQVLFGSWWVAWAQEDQQRHASTFKTSGKHSMYMTHTHIPLVKTSPMARSRSSGKENYTLLIVKSWQRKRVEGTVDVWYRLPVHQTFVMLKFILPDPKMLQKSSPVTASGLKSKRLWFTSRLQCASLNLEPDVQVLCLPHTWWTKWGRDRTPTPTQWTSPFRENNERHNAVTGPQQFWNLSEKRCKNPFSKNRECPIQ